jgi:hypothetical protein
MKPQINLNYWGVHPVARVYSNVNKPSYTTMFLVLVFIVNSHYMFRPQIGGHLQVICDKINININGSYLRIYFVTYNLKMATDLGPKHVV